MVDLQGRSVIDWCEGGLVKSLPSVVEHHHLMWNAREVMCFRLDEVPRDVLVMLDDLCFVVELKKNCLARWWGWLALLLVLVLLCLLALCFVFVMLIMVLLGGVGRGTVWRHLRCCDAPWRSDVSGAQWCVEVWVGLCCDL